MRAFNNIHRFQPGTNLKAWLFTIVRNEHYSQLRRRKFEAHGVDTRSSAGARVPPDQRRKAEYAISPRPGVTSPGQRTGADTGQCQRLLIEEAAAICACAVGTIKSRVARARETLLQMLDGTAPIPASEAQEQASSYRTGDTDCSSAKHPRPAWAWACGRHGIAAAAVS